MAHTGAVNEQEYRERLAHDIAAWQRQGLITDAQERAILARYGAGEPKAVGVLRLGWFVTAVSIIGALVLAGGVVLLFASQWQSMPTWFRAGLVFAGVSAAYGSGYALTYRYDMQRIGSALILLGVLLYEAGLFLLAQIYNMPIDNPGPLFLLAAIGAFPLAYLFGSRIIMLLALANLTGGVTTELIARYPDSPKTQSALIVIATLGIAFYAIGRLHALHRELERFVETYVFTGLLALLALIYIFSFDEPWSAMMDAGVKSYAAPPVVYVSVLLALVLVAAQWLLLPRGVEADIETGIEVVVLALAAVVATWPGWTGYAVVFNAAYFAIAGGLVTRGYLRGDERYINAGLAVVALGLITRYVDVFWSLLAGSAFFIIGGALLLAVAFAMERARRGLIRAMDTGADGIDPSVGGAPA
jgi:uncharacterized membrane protein